MKFLMEVGTQLDLNVAYNGGAADAGLTYTVPEDNGFITVNVSTGVVDAVAEGESVVWVYSGTPSVLVATVVIEVASAATYAERLAIRDGDNEVIVTAGVVPQGPPPSVQISLNTMTSVNQSGYTAFSNDNIGIQGLGLYLGFDGQVYPGWVPMFYCPNPGDSQKFGQILPANKTLTRYEIINNANTMVRKWRIEGSLNTTTGFDGTWVTLDEKADFNNWNNNIGEVYSFDVLNSVAYKAYRIVGLHNPIAPGNQWRCPELILYGH
jgi:hypothetical protein